MSSLHEKSTRLNYTPNLKTEPRIPFLWDWNSPCLPQAQPLVGPDRERGGAAGGGLLSSSSFAVALRNVETSFPAFSAAVAAAAQQLNHSRHIQICKWPSLREDALSPDLSFLPYYPIAILVHSTCYPMII